MMEPVSLTSNQIKAIAVFIALNIIDLTVTSYGVLTGSITELNPFFSQYMHTPSLFILTMFMVKSCAVLLVYIATVMFNKYDKDFGWHHGGNIVSCGSAVIMTAIMVTLLVVNIGTIGGLVAL